MLELSAREKTTTNMLTLRVSSLIIWVPTNKPTFCRVNRILIYNLVVNIILILNSDVTIQIIDKILLNECLKKKVLQISVSAAKFHQFSISSKF